jgi:hypothetical protein
LRNYSYEIFYGNFIDETSSLVEYNTQYGFLHFTHIVEPNCNIIYHTNNSYDVQPRIVSKDRLEMFVYSTNPTKTKKYEKLKLNVITKKGDPNMWTFLFDRSKYLEGAGVGYILKYLKGRNTLIACRLEFSCTNNTIEYEALLQGLRKVVELKAYKINVFGDSKTIIK